MSYVDDYDMTRCDGPGCDKTTTHSYGWRKITRRSFGPATMDTAQDFCSLACEQRAKGFDVALGAAMVRVSAGKKTVAGAVAEVMRTHLVLGEQSPKEAAAWARLMAHAWLVVAERIESEHQLDAPPVDQAIADSVAPGDAPDAIADGSPMRRLVDALMTAMHASGQLVGAGQATVQECVTATVDKVLPYVRQLALRRQSTLAREVRELVFPFRRAAEYQLCVARELEAAVAQEIKRGAS
jgi:hypothetical protein